MKSERSQVASGEAGRRDNPTERLIVWLYHRIYNDREVDAGIMMAALGIWIGAFHGALNTHPWWNEVFSILPPALWAFVLCASGVLRLAFSIKKKSSPLATVALLSSFIFAFLGLLVALVEWRMTVTPIFFLCSYFSVKSHLRIILTLRRQRADAG